MSASIDDDDDGDGDGEGTDGVAVGHQGKGPRLGRPLTTNGGKRAEAPKRGRERADFLDRPSA